MNKPSDRQLQLTALAVGELSVEEAEELLQSLTPAEAAQLDADRQTAAMLRSDMSQSLQSTLSEQEHDVIERAIDEMAQQVAVPTVPRPSSQPRLRPLHQRLRPWLRPAATALVSAAALLVAVVVSEVAVRDVAPQTETQKSVPTAAPRPTSTRAEVPLAGSLNTGARRRQSRPSWSVQSTTKVASAEPYSPPPAMALSKPRSRPRPRAPTSYRKKTADLPRPGSMAPEGDIEMLRQRLMAPRARHARPAARRAITIRENDFQSVESHPVTTIAIDVDTAAYSNVRRQIHQKRMPDPRGVRIEEFVNYFSYDLPQPEGEHPISVVADVTDAPWNPKHLLARVALNSRSVKNSDRKRANIVLLVDVSGSMARRNKLPLLKVALRRLAYSFTKKDRIAIVTYSDNASVVLPSVPGNTTDIIMEAIDRLKTGGSTNGALGLQRAYEVADKHHFLDGTNRVVIATDGDFNVGQTKQQEITQMVQNHRRRSVFLTVLGFGDDLKDSFLERLADRTDGHYAMIDTEREADRVLGQQLMSTLQVVAKDVKVQLELNPRRIAKYRLIGYENRKLDNADFNDDRVDGGEMGAGHAVTMLYELVPRSTGPTAEATERVYQTDSTPKDVDIQNDLLMVNVRYKTPEGRQSKFLRRSVHAWKEHLKASHDTRFAAAVAGFGLLLINSKYKGDLDYEDVIELAEGARGKDPGAWRSQFVDLVKRTWRIQWRSLPGRNPPFGPSTRPGPTESEIHQFVKSKRSAASKCYQEALNEGEQPSGKIELEVNLNQGQCRSSVLTPRFRKTKVGDCLSKIFAGYCGIASGRHERIVVPFVLLSRPEQTQDMWQAPVTTVTGTPRPRQLTNADILKVLRSRHSSVARCRDEQARTDPTLSGTMTVDFVLKRSGEPTRISVSPEKFVKSPVGRCVVASVSTWRFAKFTGPDMPIDFPVVIRGSPGN